MPSLLTHYEFYKLTKEKPMNIGYIGTQGPDPFFYYGHAVRPTKNARQLRKFGSFLHEVNPYTTFKYLLEYILGANRNEKEILIDYVEGMLAHYVLDKTCHPYIWYKSGFNTKEDNRPAHYFWTHTTIESDIDVLIMDHFNDSLPTFESINYDKKELKVVSKMIYSLGKGCYKDNFVKIDSFEKAVKHMRSTQKILYSKTGKKKHLFDKCFKNTPLSSMSEPKLNEIKLDFLNLNHKEWRNCVTNENPSTLDFYALFSKAQKEYLEDLKVFEDVLNGKIKPNAIDYLFNEIDHNGFPVGSVKKYSDIIFK